MLFRSRKAMIKDFLGKALFILRSIRWGWGALFAVYGFVTYAHLVKLFGSALLGAVAVYLALLAAAKLMKK